MRHRPHSYLDDVPSSTFAGVRAVRRERDRYARHPVRHVLARGFWRLLGLAALAAVAAALAPATLAATAAAAAGWWRGWPPRRLYATAAWCLPMTAAWLAAVAAWPARTAGALPAGVGPGPLWLRVAAAPYRAWLA